LKKKSTCGKGIMKQQNAENQSNKSEIGEFLVIQKIYMKLIRKE
jgi:hypothetical protein